MLAVAAQEPVHIQRRGKSRYVLLSIEQFEALNTKADHRRAVHVDDMRKNEAADMITALEHSITND